MSRSPEKLHLHPALVRLDLVHSVLERNQAARLKGQCLSEPIRITSNGTIIAGFRDWHLAVSNGRQQLACIEYSLSDEEALEYILVQHRPRRGWNNFTRVRVALELEPHFQRKALANQTAGGKLKGSANLPKAEHIEVREEIANMASVSGRTVANVKTILKKAAPALIDALQDGTLTIHRALQWCSLPQWKQVPQFTNHMVGRARDKVIRDAVSHPDNAVNASAVLDVLRQQEAREPGSLVVRFGTRQQTVIILGQDVWSRPDADTELPKA